MNPTPTPPPLLEMRHISKSFGPVQALRDVTLSVLPQTIHAVVGENGAGKSTLMKIISGVYPHGSYGGEMLLEGQQQRYAGLRDSEAKGIVIVHQELALVPLLSVMENLFLGHERARFGVVDRKAQRELGRQALAKVGLDVDLDTPVERLGVGKQQLIEIAKALLKDVRLLILDEPTASLNEVDSQALLDLMLKLKSEGITCILISHKLNEVARVADHITALRDGATVDHFSCADGPPSDDRIIQAMVGRALTERYPQREHKPGAAVLEVEGWTVTHPQHPEREALRKISFSVRAGEIVGVAGLMGAGRTELAMSLFGRSWGRPVAGTARIDGQAVDLSNVPKAMKAGLAYVTEDRKGLGLVLDQPIAFNTSLANLDALATGGVVNAAKEHSVAEQYRAQLKLRCHNVEQAVGQLSGGNQQKVVLAKWLFSEPRVLILDEPTRGIDVGAKAEIYALMAEWAAQGKAILLISSELPELLGLSDRILVMDDGEFVAEFPAAEATQERILSAILKH